MADLDADQQYDELFKGALLHRATASRHARHARPRPPTPPAPRASLTVHPSAHPSLVLLLPLLLLLLLLRSPLPPAVVLVGDAGVGKTNMLAYFTGTPSDGKAADGTTQAPTFHAMRKPTIGVEFGTRIITAPDGTKIKAQIWDTAGQERYRAITSSHYRRAAGALLVYDVSNPKSFENAKSLWLKELSESAEEGSGLLRCVMLVGNKIDMMKGAAEGLTFVTDAQHEAQAKGASPELMAARTSAKTGEGVEAAFTDLIIRIYEQDKQDHNAGFKGNSGGMTLDGTAGPKKKGCC